MANVIPTDNQPLGFRRRAFLATAAATRYPDAVVAKLVRYFRLMAPGQATAEQIAGFMAENPDWPMQGTLARRRDEAGFERSVGIEGHRATIRVAGQSPSKSFVVSSMCVRQRITAAGAYFERAPA